MKNRNFATLNHDAKYLRTVEPHNVIMVSLIISSTECHTTLTNNNRGYAHVDRIYPGGVQSVKGKQHILRDMSNNTTIFKQLAIAS